jgi:hypothetical protein
MEFINIFTASVIFKNQDDPLQHRVMGEVSNNPDSHTTHVSSVSLEIKA